MNDLWILIIAIGINIGLWIILVLLAKLGYAVSKGWPMRKDQ